MSLLQSNGPLPNFSPVIGNIDYKDTSLVFKCLNSKSVKGQLADGIKFVWGQTVDSKNKCTLFAIFEQNSISGKMIKDASVKTTKVFKIEISLTFNNEGSEKWKDMTGKNIGKSIAMIIDNKVYSAPIVRSEISNGNSIISGNFNGPEANNLVAIIKNGELPLSFKVTK